MAAQMATQTMMLLRTIVVNHVNLAQPFSRHRYVWQTNVSDFFHGSDFDIPFIASSGMDGDRHI